jgi:secreted trypsin-like serine protease
MANRSVKLLLACSLHLLSGAAGFVVTARAEDGAFASSPRIIFGTQLAARGSPVVLVRRANGSASALCTGSVIAPSVVLTAWHCVSRRAANMSVVINGKRRAVTRVRTHPGVRIGSNGAVFNDVALIQLKQKVAIAPLPLLLSRPVQIGDSLQIAGYGLTEFQTSGSLLTGFTSIDEVSENFIVSVFGRMDSNSCSGDSGGPAIGSYRDTNGQMRAGIVGITSTGTSLSCFFGDRTFFINIQSLEVIEFIRRHVPKLSSL